MGSAGTTGSEFVRWFDEIGIEDIPLVGGKNASLGEMCRELGPQGVNLAGGFAVIDARQQSLAQKWSDVQNRGTELDAELQAARLRNEDLDEQREAMLATIRDEVEALRHTLTAEVREEIAELKERWSQAVRDESQAFLRDLRRRIANETCTIARRALSDLALSSLEERAAHVFLKHVEHLEADERRQIMQAFHDREHTAIIRSAFELPSSLRETMTHALQTHLFDDLQVQFETSDELLCGIELRTDEHKLAWELGDYLETLEQEVARTLEEAAV